MADKPITQVEHLPNGWIEVSLGEICTHPQYGWTTKARNFGTIKLLRTTDISSGEVDWTTVPFCSQVPTDLEKYLIEKDDILVSRAGSVGLSFRVKEIYNFKSVFASYLIRFKVIQPILSQWVEFFFKSNDYFEQISNMVSGIALPTVNASKLNKIKIPIAPITEQNRIVKIIEEKMAELEHIRQVLEDIPLLLKAYRQAVLKTAFDGKLTEEWRENQNVNQQWVKQKAINICTVITKGSTPQEKSIIERGGIPFLKVYNIVNQKVDFDYRPQFISEKVHNSNLKRSKTYPFDVIINIVGPPLGKAAIIPEDFTEWNINQALGIFRCSDKILPQFLYYYFCEGSVFKENEQEYRGTAGQSNISLSQCRAFNVPLPSIDEQEEIVRQVEALLSIADKLELDYKEGQNLLHELPQQLLEQAFSGKLTDQDPNDEPASTLMERIRIQLDSLKEQSKTAVKQRRKMATTQKSKTKNLAEAIVQNFSDNAFTFEELASTLSEWGYEDLKDDVFNLLKINKLAMNFDQSKESLTFKLSGHDD